MSKQVLSVTYLRDHLSAGKHVPTFVYAVTGSSEMLAKYKELQGDFYRTDKETGHALWFTTRAIGKTGSLIITSNNKVVPDLGEFRMMASMAQQFGGNLGQAMANQASAMIFGPAVQAIAPAPQPVSEEQSDIEKL